MATNNWWDNVWDTITDTVQGWLGGNDEPEQPAAPPVVTPQPNRPQQAAPSTTGQPLPVPAPTPTPTPTQSNRPQIDQAAIQEEQRREQERRRREQQQREQQERREQERLDRQEARNREAKSALEQQRKQERESQNKQAEDDPWTNLLDVIRGRKPIDQAPKARPVDGTEEPEEERVSGYQPVVGLQKPEVNTGAPQISATNVANQTVTAPEVVQEVRKEEPVSRVSPIAGPINSAMIPTDLTWQAAATLIDMWRNPDRYNQEEEEREDSAMMGPFPSARSLPDWYFNSGAYAQGEVAKQRGLESAENDPERFQQEIDENKRWRKELDENPHPLTYYPQAMYTDLRNAWLELRKAAPNTGDAIADAATWVRNNIGINLMDTPARVAATEPIRPGGSTPGVFMGVAQDLTTARVDAAYPKEDNIVSSVQRAASSAAQYPGMFTIAMLSHYAPWVFLEGDRPTAEKVGQNVQNVIDLTAEITRMEEGPEKEEAKLVIPAMIGGMDMMQRRDDLIRNRPRILEEMRKQAEVLLAQGNDRAAAAIGEEMRAIENYSLQDIIDITSDPAMEFLQGFAFDPLNFLDGPIGEVFDFVRIAQINRGLTKGMRAGATVEENIPWLTRAVEEGKRIADEALANGGIIPDASTLPNASLTTRLRAGGAAPKALSHLTGLFQATRGTEVARMTKSAYAALSEIVGVIPGITVQDARTILRYLQDAPEQLVRGVPLQEFTTPAIHSTYRDTGLFQIGQNVLGSRGFMEAYPVIKLMGESLYENPYLSEALAAGDEIAQGLGVMNKEGFAAYFRSAFEDAASRMYGINSIQQMSTEIPFGTVGYRIRNATADESGGVPDVKIVEYLTENNQKLGQSGPMLGEAANKFVEDAKKIAAEPENGSLMRALQKPGNIERAIMNVTYLGLPRNWIRNGANAFAGALAEGGFNLMSKAEEVASMEKKLGGMFSDIRVAEAGEGQLARSMLGPEARGTGRRTPSADNSWERFSNWVLQFPYGNKGNRVPLGEQRWAVKIFNATFQKDFNRTIGPEIDNIIGQWLRSNGVSRKTTRKITDNLKEVARTGTKEEFMVAMRNNLLGGQSPLPLSAFGIPPGLISPEVESSIRGVVAEVAGGNTTPQQAADRVRALMRAQRQRAAEDVLRNSTSPGATNGISKDTIWDARDYENVMKSMGVPPAAANAAAQKFRDTQLQFVNTLLSDLSVGGTTPERVAIVRAVGSEVFWQQKQWRRQLDELNAHFKAGAAGLSNEMKQGWYAQQAQELSELDAEYMATINDIYQRAHRALSNDAEAAAFLADASSRGMIEDVIENYDPVTNAASRAKKYTSGRNADTKVNQEITNAWTQYVDVSMNKAWTALMSDPSPTALDDFLAADAKVRALKIATRERVDELWDIGRSQLIRDPKGGFDRSLQNRVNKLHQTSFEAQAAVWETAAEAIASRYIQSNRYVAPNGSTYQLLGITPQGAIRVRKVEGTDIGRPISTTMGSETAPSEDELAKFARMQAIKEGKVPPPASRSVPSAGQASATATGEAVDISTMKPGDAFDVPSHGRVVYQRRITRNKTKASNDPNNVGRGPTYTYVVKKENGSEVQLTANQMASATKPPVSPADTPMPGQLWKSKRHGTVEILSETTNSKGNKMFNVRDITGKERKVSAGSIGNYVGMKKVPTNDPPMSLWDNEEKLKSIEPGMDPWAIEPVTTEDLARDPDTLPLKLDLNSIIEKLASDSNFDRLAARSRFRTAVRKFRSNPEEIKKARQGLSRTEFADQLQRAFDIPDNRIDDIMMLMDAYAESTWSKYTGRPASDWYRSNIAAIRDWRAVSAHPLGAVRQLIDSAPVASVQRGSDGYHVLVGDIRKDGFPLFIINNYSAIGEDGARRTGIHELAHIWTLGLEELAKTNPQADIDYRRLVEWANPQSSEPVWGYNSIESRRYEIIADGLVRFLSDGVAPTPELAGVFERMANWLADLIVYFKQRLLRMDPGADRSVLPEDISNIYGRMFGGNGDILPDAGWTEPNRGDLWNAVSMRADTSDGRAAPEPGDMANNTLNDLDTAENTLIDAILSGRPFNEMQDGVIPAEIGQQMINHIAIMGQQWDNSVDFSRRTASDMMNRVMLDPEDRIGLDNIFRIISPYHYFWTRSAKNWAIRGIEHPWIANLYYERERDKEQQRQRNRIQNPEMPLRARDRMRIPGTDLYVSDMLDMYLPYNSFLGNEFVDPEQANNQFEKGLLFGKRHLPVFGPIMMAALSAGLDVTNPRAEGLPPRHQEFGLGDIAPQVRWGELAYQMATSKIAPWWISGDPYMYGIAGRSVATEPTPEGMDPRQAEAMRRWALDVGNQRQDGLEQLPDQPAGAIQQWERGVTESGGDKLMTRLMSEFLGPSVISVPQEELDARAIQAERRGAGYQGGENEFGSRAAIEAIDAESGQRHVSLAQYPDLYPQTYVSNPDDPDYGRPGFSASKLQRQIERDAASAEYKEQKDAFIEANLGVMPASEIKSAIYSKEEGIRAEYDKKRAAIDAKYPSADAGPDVELTQDYFLTMNPSELLEFAEERAVDAVNADATIFSMEQAMDAAADRKDWDTYYELKDEVATQKYNLLAEILMDKAAMGGFVAGLNVIVPGSEEAALKRAEELLTDTSYRSEWEEKLYAQGELERGEYNSDRTNGKQWVDEEGVQHSATGAQISKWWDEYNSQPDSAAKRQYLRDNPDFAAYYKQYRLERYGETEEYWTSTTGSTRRRMSGHPDFQRRNFGTSPYAGKFPTNTGGSGGGSQSRPATGGYNQYVADPYRISQASGGRVDLQPTQVQNPYQGANNPYATVRVDNPYDTVTPRQATVTNDWEQLLRQLTGN